MASVALTVCLCQPFRFLSWLLLGSPHAVAGSHISPPGSLSLRRPASCSLTLSQPAGGTSLPCPVHLHQSAGLPGLRRLTCDMGVVRSSGNGSWHAVTVEAFADILAISAASSPATCRGRQRGLRQLCCRIPSAERQRGRDASRGAQGEVCACPERRRARLGAEEDGACLNAGWLSAGAQAIGI